MSNSGSHSSNFHDQPDPYHSTPAAGQADPRAPPARSLATDANSYPGQHTSQHTSSMRQPNAPDQRFSQIAQYPNRMNAPFTDRSTTTYASPPTQQTAAGLPFPYSSSAPHTVPYPSSGPRTVGYSSLAGAIEQFHQRVPTPQHHSRLSPLPTLSAGGVVRRALSSLTPKAHRTPDYQRSQPGTSYSGPPMPSHRRAFSERFGAWDPLAHRGADGSSFQQREVDFNRIRRSGEEPGALADNVHQVYTSNNPVDSQLTSHLDVPNNSEPMDFQSTGHADVSNPSMDIPLTGHVDAPNDLESDLTSVHDQIPTSNPDTPVIDSVQSDRHDPAASVTAPVAAVVDPAIIDTVMHDFVHCYLARHFFGGTWPSVLDLVTDMQASCNNYDLDVQGYLDLNVSPQAEKFYNDVMAYGFECARDIWEEHLRQDGRDSRPLFLKCYINGLTLSQSYLHQYYSGDSGRAIHLTNEMVLELFRRLVMFFQDYIPELKAPMEPFNPGGLVLPSILLGVQLRKYLDGGLIRLSRRTDPTPSIMSAEEFTAMDTYRELVVAVLKTNYGAELIEIMQRESHSLSSGLEPSIQSPDGKWSSTYFYSFGYINVGPHKNQPIKTGTSLTVNTTSNFTPPSTARVPKFEPTSLSDRQRLASLYHDRLVNGRPRVTSEAEILGLPTSLGPAV